jgi:hypothetical protein
MKWLNKYKFKSKGNIEEISVLFGWNSNMDRFYGEILSNLNCVCNITEEEFLSNNLSGKHLKIGRYSISSSMVELDITEIRKRKLNKI